jgi:hypothetical protein
MRVFSRRAWLRLEKQTTQVEGNTGNRLRVIFSRGFAAKWFDYRYLLPKQQEIDYIRCKGIEKFLFAG